jgi:hypothetical protein
MSLKKEQITLVNQGLINYLKPLARIFCLALLFSAAVQAQSLAESSKEISKDGSSEIAKEVSKESSKESGRSLFARVADKFVDSVTGNSESLINNAMEMIGVRYRWGSELAQSGLDASSFVSYVFNDKLSFLLPRKSSQMSRVGKPVSREELQPGDLVFFNTMRLTFSHVGIYVGDNKFLHSPAKNASVRVDDMREVYWDKRFDGARRLDGSDSFSDEERNALMREFKALKKSTRNL